MDRLTEIKKREAAATPGPWESIGVTGFDECAIWTKDSYVIVYIDDVDFDFIINARDDIPWLIAEVGKLRAENERLKKEKE